MRRPNFFSAVVLAAATALAVSTLAARAEIGTPATPQQIRAWTTEVLPDGTGLPAGHGSVAEGEVLYETRCQSCHEAPIAPALRRRRLARADSDEVSEQLLSRRTGRLRLHPARDAADEAGLAHRESGLRALRVHLCAGRHRAGIRGHERDVAAEGRHAEPERLHARAEPAVERAAPEREPVDRAGPAAAGKPPMMATRAGAALAFEACR